MRQFDYMKYMMILAVCILGLLGIQDVWASQPNIVLTRALHFQAIDGTPITVEPGKYFVEPAGSSELRLTQEDKKRKIILQAEALTHEQYELFSPMALTRPADQHQFFITLFLPGGQKLEAKGSTKSPQPSSLPEAVPQPTRPHPSVELPRPAVTTPTPSSPVSLPIQTSPLNLQPQSPSHGLSYQPPTTRQPQKAALELTPKNDGPHLLVFAPNHLGHTIHEQPTLFWYLSEATHNPIDVMLTEQGDIAVVFEMRLLPPLEPGMHHISLKDYGIRLLPDVSYRWDVKLMTGTHQETITASGLIKRVSSSPSIPPEINQDNPSPEAPRLYAGSGLWYDAFWSLSNLLRTDPHNTTFLKQREALLDQAGLLSQKNEAIAQ